MFLEQWLIRKLSRFFLLTTYHEIFQDNRCTKIVYKNLLNNVTLHFPCMKLPTRENNMLQGLGQRCGWMEWVTLPNPIFPAEELLNRMLPELPWSASLKGKEMKHHLLFVRCVVAKLLVLVLILVGATSVDWLAHCLAILSQWLLIMCCKILYCYILSLFYVYFASGWQTN